MLTLGMVALFAGYSLGSWGYCLVKGYDIPFRAWISPLHPYTWPSGGGDPPLIPPSQLFPSSASSAGGGSSSNNPAVPGGDQGILGPTGALPL